jgi:uncharacterized membrane protein
MASDKLKENETNKQSEKLPDSAQAKGTTAILFIIIGIVGIIATAIVLIFRYKSSSNASELTMPILFGFLPFVVSFMLIKVGINKLLGKK